VDVPVVTEVLGPVSILQKNQEVLAGVRVCHRVPHQKLFAKVLAGFSGKRITGRFLLLGTLVDRRCSWTRQHLTGLQVSVVEERAVLSTGGVAEVVAPLLDAAHQLAFAGTGYGGVHVDNLVGFRAARTHGEVSAARG